MPDTEMPKVWVWEVEPRLFIHYDVCTTLTNWYSIGKKLQLVITHFQKSFLSHLKYQ